MTNVIISGPFGRMGQALCRLTGENPDINFLGGLTSPAPNKTPKSPSALTVPLYTQLSDIPRDGKRPFVLIDFTEPGATITRLHQAAEFQIPVVVGTTGFSPDQLKQITAISKQIPILLSANMSLGINLLLDIVQDLASCLSDYDIEITETHHRLKKDAPSGTALALARAAAAGREASLDDIAVHGRTGLTGERPLSEIGIHAIRGGDVVGDHTVLFAGLGERIELTHKASSRDTFAAGAIFAAQFLATQPPGLYTMKDALAKT